MQIDNFIFQGEKVMNYPLIGIIGLCVISIPIIIFYSGKCKNCGYWLTYRKVVQVGTTQDPYYQKTRNCPKCKASVPIESDIID